MLTDEQRGKLLVLGWGVKPAYLRSGKYVARDLNKPYLRRAMRAGNNYIRYFDTEQDAYDAIMVEIFGGGK